MKRTKTPEDWSIFLFWLVSLAHLIAVTVNLKTLGYLTKPLLMVFLAIYFLDHTYKKNRRLIIAPLVALVFSWAGDIFLLFSGKNEFWFITGLGSFLIAQIFYIITYRIYRFPVIQKHHPIKKFLLYSFLVLFAMVLWSKLYPVLDGFRLPVTLYTLAILTMTLSAAGRLGRTSSRSFILVISGSVLFLISDTLIALNKFLVTIPQERLLIMASYITGQFLIIHGLLAHSRHGCDQPA